jgi:crotonobetainyl-CoA:carnitine CoA-transferase CaiB-like acyl-CoA transferase
VSSALDPLPLEGIKVVEFAQMVAGPSTGLLLADYGAEVIKIEPPQGDSCRQLRTRAASALENAPVFIGYNRNKTLIRLDLRNPDDLKKAEELIAQADVLIESARPGAMDRLGLGADVLVARHPQLIYAAVSGFGNEGPGRSRGGVDLIVQAESGIMASTGFTDAPVKVGFTVVDAATGHALCHGIIAALFRRIRTGRGGIVRTSLYEVALHLQTGPITEYLMTGEQMPRAGNSAPLTAPADLMRCGEGAIVVSAYLEHHWAAFCRAIGGDALLIDPRFAGAVNRVAHREALLIEIEKRLQARTASEWRTILAAEGLLVGEVKDYAAIVADPVTKASGIIEQIGPDFGVRSPITLFGGKKLQLRQRNERPSAGAAFE